MNPLRLLLVAHDYPPFPLGGVAVRVSQLAPALAARGHAVTVVGLPPRSRGVASTTVETRDGVRVVRLGWPGLRLPHRLSLVHHRLVLRGAIARELRRAPADVVEVTDGFGWMPWGAPRGTPLSVRLDATRTLYVRLDGGRLDPSIHRLERSTLARAARIGAVSRWVAGELETDFPGLRAPVEVVHNAVETDVFSPDPTVAVDPGLVVFANGIEPRKGVLELARSFNAWGRRFPGARLVLAGADNHEGADGRKYSATCLDAIDADLRARVTFLGRLDRVAGLVPLLRRAAVAVYPSRAETFGIAPLEAMACGRPVVYTSRGPGPELIRDGEDGLLVDPADTGALAGAIGRVLADPALGERLGREARRTCERRFAVADWVGRNEAYFARVSPLKTAP